MCRIFSGSIQNLMKVINATDSSTVSMWRKSVISHSTTYNYTNPTAITFLLESIQLIPHTYPIVDMITMMYQMTTSSKISRWFNYQLSVAAHSHDTQLFTTMASNPRSLLIEADKLSAPESEIVDTLFDIECRAITNMIQSLGDDDYYTSLAIVTMGMGNSVQKLFDLTHILPQYIVFRNGPLIVRLKSIEVLSALAKRQYTVRGTTIPDNIVTTLTTDWDLYIKMRTRYMDHINNIS